MEDAIMILSKDSLDTCLTRGAIQYWKIDERRFNECQYVVMVQKGGFHHGDAMFIAKISSFAREQTSGMNRFRIFFQEYAILPEGLHVWPGYRYPVTYTALAALGVDPATLSWQIVNEDGVQPAADTNAASAQLSIATMKEMLAHQFAVPSSAIEITIRI